MPPATMPPAVLPLVERFPDAKILCVGDVMADCFVQGVIERISPESPVPVLLAKSAQTCPGGAANVARNIAALGGRCTLLGVVGDDEAGRALAAELGAIAAIHAELLVSPGRKTTEKKRFMAQGQQVLRVDNEDASAISKAEADRLVAAIAHQIKSHHVLVLSDYAKGVLTDAVARQAIALARDNGVAVVVDPKSADLNRYRGASVITPNLRELAVATGLDPSGSDTAAATAAMRGLELADTHALLLTRAERGMTLVRRDKPALHLPADVREVFDVAGAGDTVIATLALALAAGGDLEEAARAANLAAGIAVGKRGTSTVSQSELLQAQARHRPGHAKILDLAGLTGRVETWRRGGLRLGFTNGCFDILHLGHVRLLEFARNNCDRLIVATNSDASVRRLKGAGRPVNAASDRAELLAALHMVDAVIVFDQDTPQALIAAVMPDVLVKGADYPLEKIVGAKTVAARGGTVLRFALVPDKSTSLVLEKTDGGPAGAD